MELKISEIPTIYITDGSAHREDRLLEELDKIGSRERIKILGQSGKELGKGPAWGNAMAQQTALDLACRLKGPVLILEDDCIMSDYFNDRIGFPDNADGVYLGNSQFGVTSYNPSDKYSYSSGSVSWEPFSEHLVKLNSMMGTHAILYVSDKFKEMAKTFCQFAIDNEEVNLDIYFATGMNFFDVYALKKPPFLQTSQYQMSSYIFADDV